MPFTVDQGGETTRITKKKRIGRKLIVLAGVFDTAGIERESLRGAEHKAVPPRKLRSGG